MKSCDGKFIHFKSDSLSQGQISLPSQLNLCKKQETKSYYIEAENVTEDEKEIEEKTLESTLENIRYVGNEDISSANARKLNVFYITK